MNLKEFLQEKNTGVNCLSRGTWHKVYYGRVYHYFEKDSETPICNSGVSLSSWERRYCHSLPLERAQRSYNGLCKKCARKMGVHHGHKPYE